jgi:nucleoid-associated protein YgaU
MFVKMLIIVGIAVLAWSVTARSSSAHGAKQVVTVHPYQTLWSIAQQHYGGDVRDAIWRIERANHLSGAEVRAGQRLVLP